MRPISDMAGSDRIVIPYAALEATTAATLLMPWACRANQRIRKRRSPSSLLHCPEVAILHRAWLESAAMPFAVRRYFCVGERGESGCDISISPADSAGFM